MLEKALAHLNSAWDTIKSGDFFNESANNALEMMLKSLWKTEKKDEIKAEILANLNAIYHKIKDLEVPAPILLILISLKDEEILHKIEGLIIADFIADKASENSVFNVGNLVNTLADKNLPVAGVVNMIVRYMKQDFHKQYCLALSHIISIQHPEFIPAFVKHFLSFDDVSWIKEYIKSVGKRALLEAMKLADDPIKLNKIIGGANVKGN